MLKHFYELNLDRGLRMIFIFLLVFLSFIFNLN